MNTYSLYHNTEAAKACKDSLRSLVLYFQIGVDGLGDHSPDADRNNAGKPNRRGCRQTVFRMAFGDLFPAMRDIG
jgi:hypothetical protein